ncbi:carbon-nitrogen hydrolase family protein [Paracoccus aerodenitrificans]|uniref:carbon-nitrogen hydrolase family protein n=1 Tax=Paracoccus aerodenitrificans TaxID=3017781 RepID=UPI0022EFFB9B|nr:carbon-nitrogen hydrolase family protein [Paracoccus aerodenitrificans]WBU64296.1 carbon-nitrogen hydrolase family protein [Paracoccus aerodenitrificans]
MKVATAEFPDEAERYEAAIEGIAHHVAGEKPDLLVLPEMPFTPWIFCVDRFDTNQWKKTVETHAMWLERFASDVSAPLITSRPANLDGKRLNQAIYLDDQRQIHPLRSKYYLPDDYPAVEAPWFDRGDVPGEVFELGGCQIGVQLCSELIYAETPRKLGRNGAEIIVQSRATGNTPRWRAASVLGAGTSGAFVIGANRRSVARDWFTGGSWVYSPEGDLLAETSADQPVVSVEIDLSRSKAAKQEYPVTMINRYGE